MKYYAVTNDPNELMHFGIKGMKWGVIRTPEQLGHYQKPKMPKGMKPLKQTKPHSPAYMKASAKLSKAMRQGIAKAQTNWKVYNSSENKQIRAENREVNKQVRAYKRNEKKFQKHLELARQGRLKYKGISDDEVNRITDRLALERQSRSLSGAEGKRFRTRLAESIGAGVIQGVGQGVATGVGEFVGRGSRLKTQRLMNEQNEEFARQRARREANARRKEKREDAKYERELKRQQDAEDDREKYGKLVEANRIMNYGTAYGDNNVNFDFESGRKARRLTDSQIQARIAVLEDARKLYGTAYETKAKAKNGAKTEKRTDPDTGKEYEVTLYSTPQDNKASVKTHTNEAGHRVYRRVDKSKVLDNPDTPHKVVMPSGESTNTDDRETIRAAINAQKTSPVISENERYRIGMQRMLKEAEVRDRRRAQNEGYAYYETRRLSREANPDVYLPSVPTKTMVEANKQNTAYKKEQARLIRAAARDATAQYRQNSALMNAQIRTARQNEQKMFNGRTIPSATYPIYGNQRKRQNRKTRHASISDVYNLRG